MIPTKVVFCALCLFFLSATVFKSNTSYAQHHQVHHSSKAAATDSLKEAKATRIFVTVDHLTDEPLANVHVMLGNRMIGFTQGNGSFSYSDSFDRIWVHAIGYQDTRVLADTVRMIPTIYEAEHELVINGISEELNIQSYTQSEQSSQLEEMLNGIDGVSMIQRGAYAWEPTIRGLDDQRIQVTIDGMQIFKACVDKMDPITAYVDMDNLELLRVDKAGSNVSDGGGKAGIDLVTKRPSFSPFQWSAASTYRLPDGYRSLSGQTEFSVGQHAVRATGSFKQADDLVAGNNKSVPNSGYQKQNANLAYTYDLDNEAVLDLSYIIDYATDVGYPALLMDATRATAHIFKAEMRWLHGPSSPPHRRIMVYGNRVEHVMDDYSRDVRNREVMRNMYMPMYGETQTYGVRVEQMLHINSHRINLVADTYRSEAFGDMRMESIFDIPDMYLVNLGDIQTLNTSLSANARWFPIRNLVVNTDLGLHRNNVHLRNTESIAFFNGLYEDVGSRKTFFLPSLSLSGLWMMNDKLSVNAKWVQSYRAPSYTELYGHYIYNYVDGFFYDGNPILKPEVSSNVELSIQRQDNRDAWTLTGHYRTISNYIFGVIDQDLSNEFYQFKRYSQQGNAAIAGVETRWIHDWSDGLRSDMRATYTYAHHIDLDDPLPLIAPLNGLAKINYSSNSWGISLVANGAIKQERISSIQSIEDQTNAFVTFGIELQKSWPKLPLHMQFKVDNVTDQLYHRHTSIGNIPEAGRLFMVSISYGKIL